MGNKMNFIKTNDENTMKKLIEEGVTFVQKEGNYWVFLNDGKLSFDNNQKNITFSNNLLM